MASITEMPFSRRDILKAGLVSGGALGLGAPLLAACGGSGASGAGADDVLHYLSANTDPASLAWDKTITNAFKKAHPNANITGENVNATSAWFTKMQTEIASGKPPNLLLDSEDTVAATLYSNKQTPPMNATIEKIGVNRFRPVSLQRAKASNGDYFLVPLNVHAMCFWYRTDLATQAGYSSEPKSWDDLLAFGKALTNKNEKKYGVTLPLGANVATNRVFFSFIRENGGNVVDPDLNVVFDSPQNVETVEFLTELAQYSPPGSSNFGYSDLVSNFVNGTTASTWYVGRIITTVVQTAPTLAPHIAVGPRATPGGTGQQFPYVAQQGPVFVNHASQTLASDWITKFMVQPDYYVPYMDLVAGQNIPTLNDVEKLSAYADFPIRKNYPEIMQFLDDSTDQGGSYMRESTDHPINSACAQLDEGTTMANILQSAIVNKVPAKKAVKDGAAKIQELMKGAHKV